MVIYYVSIIIQIQKGSSQTIPHNTQFLLYTGQRHHLQNSNAYGTWKTARYYYLSFVKAYQVEGPLQDSFMIHPLSSIQEPSRTRTSTPTFSRHSHSPHQLAPPFHH